ncbi:insecticide toxin TcdB [Metarhizium robertsii]|uniref:Insecticide toxin TcdB n=1 Tax=Metarhizium robertsii TaxID=568076 RepID=A0A0A1UP89_9HYPO|nr:insecticide toxin TcdB [Metarhizium robertsii]
MWPGITMEIMILTDRHPHDRTHGYAGMILSPSTAPALSLQSFGKLPTGLGSDKYQWVDLDGEGIAGVLTEQGNAWFYKRNFGDAELGPLETVAQKPSSIPLNGKSQLLDLGGNGQLSLVDFSGVTPGFFKKIANEDWSSFTPFKFLPNIRWDDPTLLVIDLTDGFAPMEHRRVSLDERIGPRIVLGDDETSIHLADMSGDGLLDIVRIPNSEICYWLNLGYGRLGRFSQSRIRLADIDGSGTTDLVYLGLDDIKIFFNQSGSSFSDPYCMVQTPRVDNLSDVRIVDLFGTGTPCILWSSPNPSDYGHHVGYIDLLGGQKPHLLISSQNNLGAETRIQYASSTKFYLQDRAARTPWVTNLPFPVHVVESVENVDRHHGFFDTFEREFRGFGMVEQYDTEEFDISLGGSVSVPARDNTTTSIDLASHVPPVLTKTWYYTGAFLERQTMAGRFQQEYYKEPRLSEEQTAAMLLAEVEEVPTSIRLTASNRVPFSATNLEARESCRVLKGTVLRVELYALDAKTGDNGSVQTGNPYSVSAQNYSVEILQPQGTNRHGAFMRTMYSVSGIPSPTANPRVTHEFALEVNEFGVPTKSAEVYYGRRHKDPRPLLTDDEKEKQRKLSITYKEKDFLNVILGQDTNRTPISCEARTYELYNIARESKINHITNLFSFEEIQEKIATAEDGNHDLPFEDFDGTSATDPSQSYRRLTSISRTYYRSDDLSHILPLRTIESMVLQSTIYRLALTESLATNNFVGAGKVSQTELDDILENDLFYSPNSGDSPAAEMAFAQQHFFNIHRFLSPFHRDNFNTDTTDVRQDPFGNLITVGELLQPWMVMDHDQNRSAVAYDVLGIMTRFMYDVFAFFRTKDQEQPQPAAASNLTCETHASDLQPGRRPGIQYSFSYSDGFGREI